VAASSSVAAAASSAAVEQARAAVITATTFSEVKEKGMDAVRPPRFCAHVGIDAFPPPMTTNPPACDAADPTNPALFLRTADGGSFAGDSPTPITSSGQLSTPPDPQWYKFMYLGALPYLPLPAPAGDDPQYDGYRGNAEACLQAMGLSFPPGRFVVSVTSAVAQSYHAAKKAVLERVDAAASAAQERKREEAKMKSRFSFPWQQQQSSTSSSSAASAAADTTAATASATAAAPATAVAPATAAAAPPPPPTTTTAATELDAGFAKALVFHSRTGTDVFVVFRGSMSQNDFDHINLVIYPMEAGEFYGATNGEKVFVVRFFIIFSVSF
jgi:hypothetical protein